MRKTLLSIIIIGLLLFISSFNASLNKTMAYGQDDVVETFITGSTYFSEKNCYIHGSINGPFVCLRIPGLIYYVASNAGGDIYIEYPYFTLYQPGDYFKMIIIGWNGFFMPPLHNGCNLMSREFEGYADIVNFEVY